MKKLIISIIYFLFSLFMWANTDIEKKKIYKKEFSVNESTDIKVHSSYGKVQVETWNKNSVLFYVEILVDGKKEVDVIKKLNSIKIEFSKGNNWRKAKTVFNNVRTKKINVKINYIIKMPATNNLETHLNYSDLYLPPFLNSVYFSGNYSDIISNVKINVFNFKGNYSEVKNVSSKQINISSNYSSFKFLEIDKLDFKGNYSNIKIDKLKENLNFSGNYSDLLVQETGLNVNNVSLSGNYNNFIITGNTHTKIKATGHYSDIKINTSKYQVTVNKNKNSSLNFEANSPKSTKTTIIFKGAYSDINLK